MLDTAVIVKGETEALEFPPLSPGLDTSALTEALVVEDAEDVKLEFDNKLDVAD